MKTTPSRSFSRARPAARPFLPQILRPLLAGALCSLATLAHAADETVAGNLTVTGTAAVNATAASTSKDTGALVVEGGVGVEENVTIGGSLVLPGGGSIGGNDGALNFNGKVSTFSSFNFNQYGGGGLAVDYLSGPQSINGVLLHSARTDNNSLIALNGAGIGGASGSMGAYVIPTGIDLGGALAGGGLILGAANNGAAANNHIYFQTSGTERLRLTNSGNLLLSTTTDSGNGRLQLANHADSTGGLGFGSDTSLHRTDAGQLMLRSSATQPGYFIRSTAFTTAGGMRIAGGGGELLQIGSGYAGSSNFAEVQIGPGSTMAPELTISTTKVKVVPATASTSSSTGALVVNGGAGIGGNLNVGGSGLFIGQVITTQGSNQSIRMDGTGEFGLEWRDTASGVRWDIWNGVNGSYGENWDNHLIFHQRDNGSGQAGIVATLTPSRNFFIKNSLGLGTPAPTAKLDVVGDAKISGNLSTGSLTIGGQAFDPLYYLRSSSNTAAVLSPGSTTNFTEGLRVNDAANGHALVHLGGSAASGTGGGQWTILKDPSGKFGLRENGTERLSILPSSGNVGIGTTAPLAKFHVEGTGAAEARVSSIVAVNDYPTSLATGLTLERRLAVANSGLLPGGGLTIDFRNADQQNVTNPATLAAQVGVMNTYAQNNNAQPALFFKTGNSGTMAEAMRIVHNGHVGIGTTTPSYRLNVLDPSSMWAASFGGGSAAPNWVNIGTQATGNVPVMQGYTNSYGGASNMSLQPYGGNLGIGTTAPLATLHVERTGAAEARISSVVAANDYPASLVTGLTLERRLAVANSGLLPGGGLTIDFRNADQQNVTNPATLVAQIGVLNTNGQNNNAQPALFFKSGNGGTMAEAMRIMYNGNVGIGTTAPATSLTVASDNVVSGGVTIGSGTAADGGNLRLLSSTNHWNLDNYAGDLRFFTETGYGTGGATRMTLTKEGNLSVGGNLTVSGTLTPSAVSSAGQISGQSFGSDNGNFTLAGGPGTHALSLNSGSGTVATFNAAGTGYASGNLLTLSSDTGNGSNNFIRFRAGMAATPIDFGSIKFDGATGLMVNSGGDLSLSAGGASGSIKLSPATTGGIAIRVAAPSAKFHYNSTVAAPFAPDVNIGSPDVLFTAGDQQQSAFIARFAAGVVNTASTTSLDLATLSKNVEYDSGFRLTAGTGTGVTNNNGYFAISGLRSRAANVSELLRLTSSGNLGIGTTTPNSKLEIAGGSGTAATVKTTTDAIGDTTQLNLGANPSIPQGGAILKSVRTSASGSNTDLAVLTTFSGVQGEVMRVTSSGNVGIGTTTPNQKLTVKGAISVEKAGAVNNGVGASDLALPYGSAVRFANDVNNDTMPMLTLGNYDGKANTLRIGTDAWPSQITFRTGDLYSAIPGGQRMVIDNQGNVGIGTTNPTVKLEVTGNAKISGNLNVGTLAFNGTPFTPSEYLKTTGGGNLSVTSLTASGGTISGGGAGGLTISSTAGTDTNIYLDPTGTGDVVIPAGNTLKMNGATQRLGQINIGTNTGTNANDAEPVALLDFGDATHAGSLRGTANATTNQATWTFGYRYKTAAPENADKFEPGLTLATTATGTTSLTGGAAGLTINAGGSTTAPNQNITLTPSGTGSTILNGNVGIGTSAPGSQLTQDGSGNGKFYEALNSTIASGKGGLVFSRYTDANAGSTVGIGNNFYFASGGGNSRQDTSNSGWQIELNNRVGGDLYRLNYISSTGQVSSFMAVNSGGNVGIGTAAPNYKLEVAGSMAATSGSVIAGNAGSTRVQMNAGGSIAEYFNAEANARWIVGRDIVGGSRSGIGFGPLNGGAVLNYVGTNPSSDLGFYTNGSANERLTITATGNVGIGTTAPTVKLEVTGDTKTNGNVTVSGNTTLGTASTNSVTINATTTLAGALNANAGVNASALISGSLTGGASGLGLSAGSANQNISLTTTGTGSVVIASAASAASGAVQIVSADPTLRFKATYLPVANQNEFEIRNISRSDYNPAQSYLQFRTINDAHTAFTERMSLSNSGGFHLGSTYSDPGSGNMSVEGNLLLGLTTSGTNGRLQLATHATATGGIGFGSDVSLFRNDTSSLKLDSQKLVLATGAKLGIGTDAPASELTVVGAGAVTGNLEVNTSGVSGGGLIVGSAGTPNGGNVQLLNNTTRWSLENSSGNLVFSRQATTPGAAKTAASTISGADASIVFDGKVSSKGLDVSGGNGVEANFHNLRLQNIGPPSVGTDATNMTYVVGSIDSAVPFNWNVGQSKIWLKNAAHKLGLGTDTPAYKLDVRDSGGAQIGDLAVGKGLFLKAASGQTWLMGVATGSPAGFKIADATNTSAVVDRLVVSATGAVGLGTSTPVSRLDVVAPAADTARGAQVIVTAPHISGSANNGADNFILFRTGWHNATSGTAGLASIGYNDAGSAAGKLWFATASAVSEVNNAPVKRMTIDGQGNVAIGTQSTTAGVETFRLSVDGKVRAREVVVNNDTWADYVFADGYRNAPLTEVEQHIKEHKHLPGVPSAQEVAEKGVNVGQMQALMLSKIEELTLHMIAQEKRIQRLESENSALRAIR